MRLVLTQGSDNIELKINEATAPEYLDPLDMNMGHALIHNKHSMHL